MASSHWGCLGPAMRGWDGGRRERRLVSYHERGRRLAPGGREQKSSWNESMPASLQLCNLWTRCCQPLVTGELPKALSHPQRLAHRLACSTHSAWKVFSEPFYKLLQGPWRHQGCLGCCSTASRSVMFCSAAWQHTQP